MLPENILNSDLLDIVFEHRNKGYGAYALRKYYPQRLQLALGLVGFAVLIFALLQQLKPASANNVVIPVADTIKLVSVVLPPEVPTPVKPVVQHREVATVNNNTVVVVPDAQVRDTIATVATLDVSALGDRNSPGEPAEQGQIFGQVGEPCGASDPVKKEPADMVSNTPLEMAEKMPEFPGGMNAFIKFMQRNLRKPDELEAGQKVVILTRFIVQADGTISGIQILQHGTPELDKEVLRVVNKMPKWIPGVQRGKNVPVYFKLPVTFMAEE